VVVEAERVAGVGGVGGGGGGGGGCHVSPADGRLRSS